MKDDLWKALSCYRERLGVSQAALRVATLTKSDLVKMVLDLGQQRDELLAWKHHNGFFAKIGKAVELACRDLPEGFDILLGLEKGAGTVRLYLADSDAHINELGDGDVADQIYNAINIAQAKGGAV